MNGEADEDCSGLILCGRCTRPVILPFCTPDGYSDGCDHGMSYTDDPEMFTEQHECW